MTSSSPPGSPLELLKPLVESRRGHWILVLALALAFHGNLLGFGLVYDDRQLLGTHWEWLRSPWSYADYYRPLQTLLFLPALVSSNPVVLHLESIVIGAVIILLFGELLARLGFGSGLVLAVEAIGVVMPPSIMLFAWISQRTEWFGDLAGLTLILLSFSPRARGGWYPMWYVTLSAIALLAKETGVAVVAMVPLFVGLYHRRWRQSLVLGGAGALVLIGYLQLRGAILTAPPVHGSAASIALRATFGLLETLVYPYVQVCFTSNALYLALNLAFMVLGIAGLASLWRLDRDRAAALLTVFAGFAVGMALYAEPRNLVIPSLVAVTFACHGTDCALRSAWGRARKAAAVLLAAANACALAVITVSSSFALQDWVERASTIVEAHEKVEDRRGYIHAIDVNTDFRRKVHDALRARFLPAPARPDSTANHTVPRSESGGRP